MEKYAHSSATHTTVLHSWMNGLELYSSPPCLRTQFRFEFQSFNTCRYIGVSNYPPRLMKAMEKLTPESPVCRKWQKKLGKKCRKMFFPDPEISGNLSSAIGLMSVVAKTFCFRSFPEFFCHPRNASSTPLSGLSANFFQLFSARVVIGTFPRQEKYATVQPAVNQLELHPRYNYESACLTSSSI